MIDVDLILIVALAVVSIVFVIFLGTPKKRP